MVCRSGWFCDQRQEVRTEGPRYLERSYPWRPKVDPMKSSNPDVPVLSSRDEDSIGMPPTAGAERRENLVRAEAGAECYRHVRSQRTV